MDSREDKGSIEEISLSSKTVFGNKESKFNLDLMKGIIINIRIGKNIEEFFMEYWMEQGLECGREQGREQGRKEGIKTERLNAIERMLKAGATKSQIISYGYTEEELAEKEDILFADV